MSPAAREFTLKIANSAAKALRKIEPESQKRIVRAIDALALDPRPTGVKRLVADERLYRIRVGDFRIIYQVKDSILLVLVVAIGNRRDVYR